MLLLGCRIDLQEVGGKNKHFLHLGHGGVVYDLLCVIGFEQAAHRPSVFIQRVLGLLRFMRDSLD